jgi:hypothetical protein
LTVGGESLEGLVSGLGPDERFRVLVPFAGPFAQVSFEFADGPVRGTAELAAGELGEPPLDQVHPGGAGRVKCSGTAGGCCRPPYLAIDRWSTAVLLDDGCRPRAEDHEGRAVMKWRKRTGVRARVPTYMSTSYGYQMADHLRGTCSLCRVQPRVWDLSRAGPELDRALDREWHLACAALHRRFALTDVPDNVYTAARPFPGPRHVSWPEVPDNRPLALIFH